MIILQAIQKQGQLMKNKLVLLLFFLLSCLLYIPLAAVIILYFNNTITYIGAAFIMIAYNTIFNCIGMSRQMKRKDIRFYLSILIEPALLLTALVLLHYGYTYYAYFTVLLNIVLIIIITLYNLRKKPNHEIGQKYFMSTSEQNEKAKYVFMLILYSVILLAALILIKFHTTVLFIYFAYQAITILITLFIRFFKNTIFIIMLIFGKKEDIK